MEKITLDANNKLSTSVALIDMSKAFDSISHEILLHKLLWYGFSDSTILLFKSYITGRKQRVKIGNALSTECTTIQASLKARGWGRLSSIFTSMIYTSKLKTVPFSNSLTIFAYRQRIVSPILLPNPCLTTAAPFWLGLVLTNL